MPEQVTRAFQDAREAAGIKGDNPPQLTRDPQLSDSGWAIERAQGLMDTRPHQ